MKFLVFFLSVICSLQVFAGFVIDCPAGQHRVNIPSGGVSCVNDSPAANSAIAYCPNGDYVTSPGGVIRCASDSTVNTADPYCPSGQYVTGYAGGYYCQDHILGPPTPGPTTNCVTCNQNYYQQQQQFYGPYNPYAQRPAYPFYNPGPTPWWGQQGPIYYNNFNYPGPWTPGAQGIQPHHYPGGGGGFAAKPNIYIQNAQIDNVIEVSFAQEQISEMLVTTPSLDKDNKWQTKPTKDNKFLVDNIEYDYLFYDLRFDHKKLQYSHGFCSDRKTIIDYMLTDLNTLKYSDISVKDFDEHWNQKIPKIKNYCLYPQYNVQLDEAYPIKLKPQVAITRVLYLVIPHEDSPKVRDGQFPPLPVGRPQMIRPRLPSSDQMVLKEWGVSFLMENVIK